MSAAIDDPAGEDDATGEPAALITVDRYYLAWTEYQTELGEEPRAQQLSAYLANKKGMNGRGGKPVSSSTLCRYLLPFRVYNVWAKQRVRNETPSFDVIAQERSPRHHCTAQQAPHHRLRCRAGCRLRAALAGTDPPPRAVTAVRRPPARPCGHASGAISPEGQAVLDVLRAMLAVLRAPEPWTPGRIQEVAVRVGQFIERAHARPGNHGPDVIAVALVRLDTPHAAAHAHRYSSEGWLRCETSAILGIWQSAHRMLSLVTDASGSKIGGTRGGARPPGPGDVRVPEPLDEGGRGLARRPARLLVGCRCRFLLRRSDLWVPPAG
ncbi:hypothetical protein ACWDAO_20165 [Streptomyces sp. NPDC001212]|uniref:hypothetical protein n=1 Tax=Streptomyces sp. HYC2 TaxID=2955207 RepID=UPI0024812059|nr:hypothetical protein [Streptomyces sp. HYC2]